MVMKGCAGRASEFRERLLSGQMSLLQPTGDGSSFRSKRVLLVGGGRWARVHAGVLRTLLPKGGEILWVTRHNVATVGTHISAWNDDRVGARLFDDLIEAL